MKIKELIAKVKTKVSNFLKSIKKTAQDVIPIGIEVVNQMKKITDSKYVDIITQLTPTNADDKAVSLLRVLLPKLLKEMEQWQDIVSLSDEEIVKQAIITINSYPKIKKNAIYLSIASAINSELSYGEMTMAESITATHEAYNNPQLLNS